MPSQWGCAPALLRRACTWKGRLGPLLPWFHCGCWLGRLWPSGLPPRLGTAQRRGGQHRKHSAARSCCWSGRLRPSGRPPQRGSARLLCGLRCKHSAAPSCPWCGRAGVRRESRPRLQGLGGGCFATSCASSLPAGRRFPARCRGPATARCGSFRCLATSCFATSCFATSCDPAAWQTLCPFAAPSPRLCVRSSP